MQNRYWPTPRSMGYLVWTVKFSEKIVGAAIIAHTFIDIKAFDSSSLFSSGRKMSSNDQGLL